MTWRYMKIFLILTFSAALVLSVLSSCDSKKKAICDLEELSTDMRYHSTEYDADKWEEVAEKHQNINERLNDAELTPEELRHIGKIRGEIAGYATNEAARELHQVIRDALNEASGFVDVFLKLQYPNHWYMFRRICWMLGFILLHGIFVTIIPASDTTVNNRLSTSANRGSRRPSSRNNGYHFRRR